ncbi:hypothetical protein BDP27DRAFT_1370055 [Rhodocollybia butyracea]|uniref:Uncharacterized protein n=1 Tax=Rhodocollybia butyracea TaxID=206335 RepID=A0A9P5U0W8_9AGAR|nr:hypothetical protein BDP27DRAFT_1370055 [Rhodocollybia butyracea]
MKDNLEVASNTQMYPPRFNFNKTTPRRLPLKGILFGLKYLRDGYTIIFRPYSSSQVNSFSIRGPDNFQETITFAQSIRNVAIGRANVGAPCVQFTTKALDSQSSHRTLFPGIGRKWSDDFQQGGKTFYPRWKHHLMFLGVLGCKGTVTIKFDTRDNTWSHETFDEFRFLCKNAAQNYTWDKAFKAAGVSQDDLIANGKPRAMNTEYQSGKMSSNSPGQSSKASLKFKKIKLSDVDPPTKRRKTSPICPRSFVWKYPTTMKETPGSESTTRAHNTPSGNTPTATKEISGSELTTRIINTEPELDLSSSELNKHPENTILPIVPPSGPRPQPNKTRSSGSTSKAAVPNKTIRPKKVSKTDQMSD